MARVRTPVTATVEWAGTDYDVTDDVISAQVVHGSGTGSAERSTVQVGNGYITLQGPRYEPGNPLAIGDVVTLTNRAPIEIKQGTTTLWEGFIEQPRVTPHGTEPRSRYKLTGKSPTDRQVDYAHTRMGLPAAADWRSILGQVPVFTGAPPTEQFGPYEYKGGALLYVSNLAQVLGRLVGENRTGQIVLPPYAQNIPEDLVGAIESDDKLFIGARTNTDTRQIKNQIIIPYTITDRVSVNQGEEDTLVQQGGATSTARPAQTYTGMLNIPPAPMGTLYSNYEVEILSAYGTAIAEKINNKVTGYQEIDVTDFLTSSVTVDNNVATVLISSSLRNATLDWTWENITRTTVDREITTGESSRQSRSFGPFASRATAITQRNAFNPTCSGTQNPTNVTRTIVETAGALTGSGTFTNESHRVGPFTSQAAALAAARAYSPACDSGSASSINRDTEQGTSSTEGSGMFTNSSRRLGPYTSAAAAASAGAAFTPTCSFGAPSNITRTPSSTTETTTEPVPGGGAAGSYEGPRRNTEAAAQSDADDYTITACDDPSGVSRTTRSEEREQGSGMFSAGFWNGDTPHATAAQAMQEANSYVIPTPAFGSPSSVTRTTQSRSARIGTGNFTTTTLRGSVWHTEQQDAQDEADDRVLPACGFGEPQAVRRTTEGRTRNVDTGRTAGARWESDEFDSFQEAVVAATAHIPSCQTGTATNIKRNTSNRTVITRTGTNRDLEWTGENDVDAGQARTAQLATDAAFAYDIPCDNPTRISRFTNRTRSTDNSSVLDHTPVVRWTCDGEDREWMGTLVNVIDTIRAITRRKSNAYVIPDCGGGFAPTNVRRDTVETSLPIGSYARVRWECANFTSDTKHKAVVTWECPVVEEIQEYRSIVTFTCETGATANRFFARVDWQVESPETVTDYYGVVNWVCGASQEVTTTNYFVTVAWRCETPQTVDAWYGVITWKCETQERETLYTGVVSWDCGDVETESVVVTTRVTEEESHMPVLWAQNDPDQDDEWQDLNIRYRVTWVAVHEGGVAAEYEQSWDMSGTAGSSVNVPEGPMEFSMQLPTPDPGTVVKDLKVELLDVIGRVPSERSDTPANDPVQEIALHQYFGISVVLGVDFRAHVRVINDVFDNRSNISYVYNERRTGQTTGLRGVFSSGQISNSNTADENDVDNFVVKDGLPAVKARWKVTYRIVTDTRRTGPNSSWTIQGNSGTDRANAARWPTMGRTFTVPAIPQPATPRTRLENERVEISSATITFPRVINQHATRTWTDAPGGPLGPGQVRFQDIDILPYVTIVSQERADGQWTVTLDAPTLADLSQGLTYRVQVLRSNGSGGGGTFTTGRQSNILKFRPRDRTWVSTFTSGFGGGFAESASIVFSTVWDEITVPVQTRRFNNPSSQVAWGIRTVEYPTWLNSDNVDANEDQVLQQLGHLAKAQTRHVVTLPLWQETAAKNAQVGAYDVGQFYDVDVEDAVHKIDIDTLAVISKRRLSWGALEVPQVRLDLLEISGVKGDPTPPMAPGIPTNVRASASDTSITLTWGAPATGGTPANYHAEWREDNTGGWSTVTTVGRSYVIRNLTASTLYGYRVRAQNDTGRSRYVTGTITTLALPLALPGPIRNLAAAADARNQLTVTWDAPNTGGAVATYSLRYRRMGTTSWATTLTGLTARSRAVTGLSDSTAIEVEVQAVNATGGGTWARVTQTTQAAPAALPIPSGLNISSDFGSIAGLAWDAVTPPEDVTLTQYRTRHKAVAQEHWTEGTTVGTSRFVSGLQTGSNYEFQVRAEYSSGNSDYSASFTWTAGSASTDPQADSSKVLYLEDKPVFLTDLPITIED